MKSIQEFRDEPVDPLHLPLPLPFRLMQDDGGLLYVCGSAANLGRKFDQQLVLLFAKVGSSLHLSSAVCISHPLDAGAGYPGGGG